MDWLYPPPSPPGPAVAPPPTYPPARAQAYLAQPCKAALQERPEIFLSYIPHYEHTISGMRTLAILLVYIISVCLGSKCGSLMVRWAIDIPSNSMTVITYFLSMCLWVMGYRNGLIPHSLRLASVHSSVYTICDLDSAFWTRVLASDGRSACIVIRN